MTKVSSRAITVSWLLEWIVVSEPSWPVHGLKHIQRFAPSALTDDDAFLDAFGGRSLPSPLP